MDYNPNSSFLLLSNEELLELHSKVSKLEEIGSEFTVLLEEELERRKLMMKIDIQRNLV